VTTRDRIVIAVVAAAALLGGYWFLILAPKRDEATKLNSQVTAAKQRRDAAVVDANASRAARAEYAVNYATVARLGKAVPANDDMPSLIYQLASTSKASNVDFREIKLTTSGGAATPPAPPSTSGSAGKGGSSGSTGSSASKGAGGSAATPVAASAAQTTTANLPPGASVGPAGLPTMPFSFTFEGSFFHLADFFGSLNNLVGLRKVAVDVRGRLLMVDGIALSASPQGFPHMKASVSATAFLVPPDQGTTNGATPSGPAAGASAKAVSTTGSSASTTPPAAAAGSSP
jgi:hypothetical protein